MFGKKSAKKGITFRFLSTVRGRTAKHRELERGGGDIQTEQQIQKDIRQKSGYRFFMTAAAAAAPKAESSMD